MRLYLTALNPTDAVLDGFLPAAARLGLPVTVLTDQPAAWPERPGVTVVGADVRDVRAVLDVVQSGEPPMAVLSNSDHLQTPTALVAEYLGLPGKDWRAALRSKDKRLTRRTLADAGLDTVAAVALGPDDDPDRAAGVPFPAVVKPREGVASEDVYLVESPAELRRRIGEIRDRRPGLPLLVEEYLPGELHTLETLGDGRELAVVGGWRTGLGSPPTFVEASLDWAPDLPRPVRDQVLAQLAALGVGFGACHTEFVVADGRARIIEVNYRLIGDRMDLVLAELLDVPLFEYVIQVHAGAPLPALPDPGSVDRHARVEYVCADRPGTLVAAPDRLDAVAPDGTRLGIRPLRPLGVTAPLTGTNRDYLAALHAIGPDATAVARALRDLRAAHRWEIRG
ncbi:acetyl-CoA carboxylase biotin carboxylase subunit family protein [Micromonospora sp. HM5-17]|uniref:ATP-grasp domain-containing protein n=1 Tax=Micromonospora sp. HM5-17 TaxID=2487710 RepID=UPI000F48AC13|nr:siderophore biosynthesis protein [Micromonospora sp. HM5-17]ROT32318.1 siderophore biosynthesis protein [Micromonospora sp. HM5-17]